MSSEALTEDDRLEQEGLIGESYDAIFQIRTRIRKIQDIEVPIRGGLMPSQFGAFLAVFVASLLSYALLVRPLLDLFGVHMYWMFLLAYLFGPPIMAAQRIVKPMRYGKTISTTMASAWRYLTDNPVHARGLPVPSRPEEDVPGETLVYQRVWVPAEDADVPEETDERAERLLAGFFPDTEQWAIDKAREHQQQWIDYQHRTGATRTDVASTRSRGSSVLDDEEQAA